MEAGPIPITSRSDRQAGHLRKNAVGLSHVVFFVIATAAPLVCIIGGSPAAFAFGNGPGVPSAFLIAGVIYLVFSVGFAAMSRFISNAGAFYAYIAHGLGRPLGVGGALIAIVTYTSCQVGAYAMIGFLLNQWVKARLGVDLQWWLYAFAMQALVYACGSRRIDFSGRILGVIMAGELTVVTVLGLAIVFSGGGPNGLNFASFTPHYVFSPGLGVALVFVIGSYIGFEATAIFSEEARDPKRTVAHATYISVTVIMVIYTFATWAAVQAWGVDAIQVAANKDPANLYFLLSTKLIGKYWTDLMGLLFCISMWATLLALHNTISRYFFALGREGLLWRGLARTHPVHQSPVVAGIVQTLMAFIMVAFIAIAGLDPFKVVLPWGSALATIGIFTIQIMVAISIIFFFRKNRLDTRAWNSLIAPTLSALGLGSMLVLVIANLPLLAGSSSPLVAGLPLFIFATGAFGALMAVYLKKRNPGLYKSLERLIEEV